MASYSIFLETEPGGATGPPCEVFLTLFGTKASSHEVAVGYPASASNRRPPPQDGELVDLGDIDLGDIQRIRVRHDEGTAAGSHLDRIVVQAAGTLQQWTFLYRQWRGHDLGVTERTLDVGRG